MKILAIADEECKALWDYFTPDKLEGVELIIACGDLSRHYLEYLATMAPMPVLYVHGNHDESYDLLPPQGVICIDDEVYVHNGLRVAGLGGSCRKRRRCCCAEHERSCQHKGYQSFGLHRVRPPVFQRITQPYPPARCIGNRHDAMPCCTPILPQNAVSVNNWIQVIQMFYIFAQKRACLCSRPSRLVIHR